MPIYEYKCIDCNNKVSEFQRIEEEPLSNCLICGGKLKRLISICDGEVDYKNSKEYYEKIIKPDAQRIIEKIKNGDEDAAADIFGENKWLK